MVLGELGEAKTGQKHPPEMKIWEWFTKLPKELRYLIAGIVALILIVATSVTSALAWYTGYTPDKLDMLLTKHGSQQQLDSMKDDLAGGAKDAIDEAVSRSQQWTMEYMTKERQLAVDTSFKPAVQMLFAVEARGRLARGSTSNRCSSRTCNQPRREVPTLQCGSTQRAGSRRACRRDCRRDRQIPV